MPAPAAATCSECQVPTATGYRQRTGAICVDCWQRLLSCATSRLCDQLSALLLNARAMTISRAVATALPQTSARLQLSLDLRALNAAPQHRWSPTREYAAVVAELTDLGVTGLAALLPQPRGGSLTHAQNRTPGMAGSHDRCALCGRERWIAGRLDGEPLCAACWRSHPKIQRHCDRCSIVDYLSIERLCHGCRADDLLGALFTEEVLARHPVLLRARDNLSASRERWLLQNLSRSGLWADFHALIGHGNLTTHEAVDEVASGRRSDELRAFLITYDVLPPRDEAVIRLERWIERSRALIIDAADRRLFDQYARWRHLRAARLVPLRDAQAAGRRRELTLIRSFLAGLHDQGGSMRTATQADIDRWLATGLADRQRIDMFLRWCRTNSVNRRLDTPARTPAPLPATSGLREDERVAGLRAALDPESSLAPRYRLAAVLILLYGIRPHQLVRLRVADLVVNDAAALVRVGNDPLELPHVAAALARDALADRLVIRAGGTFADNEWLFPGHYHGRALSTKTLSMRVRELGVEPEMARGAALGQLASQVPPAVLHRLLGITINTAAKWSAAAAAPNARYSPLSLDPVPRHTLTDRDP